MSLTQKANAPVNQGNAIIQSFNMVDKSLSTSGFLTAKVGRKITQTITTTTVSNDTLLFDHIEDGTSLFVLKIIYTDGTRSEFLSAERIS